MLSEIYFTLALAPIQAYAYCAGAMVRCIGVLAVRVCMQDLVNTAVCLPAAR